MPHAPLSQPDAPTPRRILMLGGTGTAGRATIRALLDAGHVVTCILRPGSDHAAALPESIKIIRGDATDPDGCMGATGDTTAFDTVVSCLASRSGLARDAWAIDHGAHSAWLNWAKASGVPQFILLSAICVQRPELPFQFAKLRFEEELRNSGLVYSIIRPTAFFKSLSGQIARVQAGKPFVMFGDGTLTACKPISDRDLGRFIAGCVTDPARQNRVLPVGGPGDAITPRDQAAMLFELTGRTPRFQRMPVSMMTAIIAGLSLVGRVHGPSADKADLARIGRYYGTQSMLVWDPATQRYDADATPSYGDDRLRDYYAQVIAGDASVDLGDHAVF